MQIVLLPDIVRNIERTYSRLVDDMTEWVFWAAGWVVSGSAAEIGVKAGILLVLMAALSFTLGGSKAMGDRKPGNAAMLWVGIAIVFGAGLAIAFVLMWSDASTS